MRTEEVHTLILGAGPSGLAAGYALARAGLKPVLLERDTVAGGLMRSLRRGEFVVDVGRKELYNRLAKVDAFWNQLLGDDYRTYPHRGGILYQGNVIDMTPAFRGLRRGMPWPMFLRCAWDLVWSRVRNGSKRPSTVQEYFYHSRGPALTTIFAQGFQEKLTGKRWAEVPMPDNPDEAPTPGFLATVTAAAERAFSRKEVNTFGGIWKHPARGTGQICDLVTQAMLDAGGRIVFGAAIQSMRAEAGRVQEVVATVNSEPVAYHPQHVVSSVPLEWLIHMLDGSSEPGRSAPAPPPKPKRTVILAYLFLNEPPRIPHAWLQVTCPSTRIGRITNYTAFNGDMVPPGKTALCCEFYCFGPDPLLDLDDAAIAQLTLDDCARAGLVTRQALADSLVLRLPGADASQNRDNWMQASRLRQLNHLAKFSNLFCVNRTELDIATLAGLEVAEAITSGSRAEFDSHVDPAAIGIRSEAKAFSFDLPKGVGQGTGG
ncbi:MAG: NAD(P)-binding protein [Verrucomicrobiales bacterium]